MIRILHSVSNMDRAGIETMLMNYYRHIDRKKIQFDFLCNKEKQGAYDEEIRALGGNIYHSPGLNPFKYLKYLKYMRKMFCEHSEYKIVHAHNGAFVVYPLFAAKKNRVPNRIAHVHSASFTMDYKWPLKMLCRPLIPFCATEKWACGTEAAKFYYGKKILDRGKAIVINNAIEINRFVFNEEIREHLRIENDLQDKFVVGHVGRFDSQKNHTFLVDIFKEVYKKEPRAMLVLLGEGELMKEIKDKVKELKLDDCVLFKGNVNNVNEWYQAMDVFVLPSVWEGLPVVGIEAQSADLPCAFSDDITREVDLLPSTAFIKRENSIEKWVEYILRYAKEHVRVDRSKEIKAAGYDIETEAQKLMALYEALLNNEVKGGISK